MKLAASLFISTIICWTVTMGQSKTKREIYVSKTLDYLQLINEHTLWTSIGEENDTTNYFLKEDTLFIKNEYWRTGVNHQTDHIIEWQNFEILKYTTDTLFLLNKFNGRSKPFYWEDTLKFLSLEKLKESITKFHYLKVDYANPFDRGLKLSIDSLGKVTYERTPATISASKVPIRIIGELTKNEFAKFLDTLAYSLPSKLPKQRSCGIDAAIINFEIVFNDKIVVSKGCSLKWTHAFLFNYLYNMGSNKGFVNRRKE